MSPILAKPAATHWRGRLRIDVEKVQAAYLHGLSTRQVAALFAISASRVSKICRSIARDRSTAARLRQPMQPSTHWRTCRAQARRIVERQLDRKLARHEHVHHHDGNWQNNTVANLIVLDQRTHAHVHRPPNPVPRHKRPARQAYMRQYLAQYQRNDRAGTR